MRSQVSLTGFGPGPVSSTQEDWEFVQGAPVEDEASLDLWDTLLSRDSIV